MMSYNKLKINDSSLESCLDDKKHYEGNSKERIGSVSMQTSIMNSSNSYHHFEDSSPYSTPFIQRYPLPSLSYNVKRQSLVDQSLETTQHEEPPTLYMQIVCNPKLHQNETFDDFHFDEPVFLPCMHQPVMVQAPISTLQ